MAGTSDYISYAEQQANAYGIPPQLFLNLITAESGWNPNAISSAGAEGIAQLMPSTAPDVNRFDPFASISKAAQLLAGYFKQFGSWGLAAAAYNAGPNAVTKYGGVPPYTETQNYVAKVTQGTDTGIPKGLNVSSLKILFWAAVVIVALVVLRGVSGGT